MKGSRGKYAVLVAGAGVAALALSVVLFWNELATSYFLEKLEADPDRLLQMMEQPDGTPQGNAVRAFLATEAGKRVFFGEYGRTVLESVLGPEIRRTVLEGLVWLGDGYASYFQWGRRNIGRYGIPLKKLEPGRLRTLAALLSEVEGVAFRLSEYPDLEFTVLRTGAALEELSPPFRREASSLPERDQLACVVRRTEEAAVPILTQLLSGTFIASQIDAAEALGRMGPRARDAIPALETTRSRSHEEVLFSPLLQKAVSAALERILADPDDDGAGP